MIDRALMVVVTGELDPVPDGSGGLTWRWTREPAPVRLTLVSGVPTFEDGKFTSARPGQMLGNLIEFMTYPAAGRGSWSG